MTKIRRPKSIKVSNSERFAGKYVVRILDAKVIEAYNNFAGKHVDHLSLTLNCAKDGEEIRIQHNVRITWHPESNFSKLLNELRLMPAEDEELDLSMFAGMDVMGTFEIKETTNGCRLQVSKLQRTNLED